MKPRVDHTRTAPAQIVGSLVPRCPTLFLSYLFCKHTPRLMRSLKVLGVTLPCSGARVPPAQGVNHSTHRATHPRASARPQRVDGGHSARRFGSRSSAGPTFPSAKRQRLLSRPLAASTAAPVQAKIPRPPCGMGSSSTVGLQDGHHCSFASSSASPAVPDAGGGSTSPSPPPPPPLSLPAADAGPPKHCFLVRFGSTQVVSEY